MRGQFEPKTSEYVFRVRVYEPFPAARWAVIVGEFIHNISSALDQLAWQLVKLAGNDPIDGQTGFAIFDTPEKFHDERGAPRLLQGITSHHFAEIESMQPYQPNSGIRALATLSKLWNIDKHRTLHPTATLQREARYHFFAVRDIDPPDIWTPPVLEVAMDNDAVFARIPIKPIGPNPKMGMDGQITTHVMFGESSPVAGEPADIVLNSMYHAAGAVIHTLGIDFP